MEEAGTNSTHFVDYRNDRVFNKEKLWFEKIEIDKDIYGPMIIYKGKTYAIGGGVYPYKGFFEVNSISLKFRKVGEIGQGRCRHGLVVFKQEIYVIGGIFDGDYLKSVEKFNGSDWVKVSDLNFARFEVSAVEACGKIYALCGDLENNTIEVFNNEKWRVMTQKLRLPLRRVGLACVGNEIIVAGGNLMAYRTNCNHRSCWKINCDTEVIEDIDQMGIAECFDLPGWVNEGVAMFVGLRNLCCYDIKQNEWKVQEVNDVCGSCFGSSCGTKCRIEEKINFIKIYRVLKTQFKII